MKKRPTGYCKPTGAWYVFARIKPARIACSAGQQRGTIMAHPVIDADECISCGVCVDTCPCGVLELQDVATVVDEDSCAACGACQEACPAGAITEIAED